MLIVWTVVVSALVIILRMPVLRAAAPAAPALTATARLVAELAYAALLVAGLLVLHRYMDFIVYVPLAIALVILAVGVRDAWLAQATQPVEVGAPPAIEDGVKLHDLILHHGDTLPSRRAAAAFDEGDMLHATAQVQGNVRQALLALSLSNGAPTTLGATILSGGPDRLADTAAFIAFIVDGRQAGTPIGLLYPPSHAVRAAIAQVERNKNLEDAPRLLEALAGGDGIYTKQSGAGVIKTLVRYRRQG